MEKEKRRSVINVVIKNLTNNIYMLHTLPHEIIEKICINVRHDHNRLMYKNYHASKLQHFFIRYVRPNYIKCNLCKRKYSSYYKNWRILNDEKWVCYRCYNWISENIYVDEEQPIFDEEQPIFVMNN